MGEKITPKSRVRQWSEHPMTRRDFVLGSLDAGVFLSCVLSLSTSQESIALQKNLHDVNESIQRSNNIPQIQSLMVHENSLRNKLYDSIVHAGELLGLGMGLAIIKYGLDTSNSDT
jgi:hypothetical protein